MSSLEASQILASALKDVDEILKVSEHELNEFHGAGTTSKNQDKSPDISSQGIRGISESESGNHKAVSFDATDIYRTGKEFSVLNNRLQNFIDKLSHSRRMSRVHTSEYQALDFGLTENNSSDVIQLPATRPTKLDLNVIEQPQQIQSPYILSSNEHNPYFSDKGLHRRIIKLQEQIQAQANRIAELEKDGNPLSYLVSKTNTTEYRNHEADQPSMDIDNIQLLNEVSKQHLRISLLEETNRDLEEKINKLEKELSQRSNSLQLTNSYEELQSSKYNRQYATIHSTVSSRSATLSNNMNTLDESSRQSNRLNYPTPLRRSLTPVTFNNKNCPFINISNQSEHNLTVIHQSLTAGSGTQSTPPTSRLFNDEKQYTAYNAHLLNEQPINYNNKFLLPNENYTYLYNTDQFKSASLNELRYSKIIQSNVTTTHMNTMTSCSTNNIIFNTNTSKHYLAQNRYSMKSPPTFMLNGNNIQDSNRINLLPPQYGSSYHQETYHNAHSRSLALPPALPPVTPSSLSSSSQWCRQLTKNNYIDGRQTSADCALNERVQLFNSPDKCNSPIIRRCTTSVQQHTNLPRSRNKFMLLNASSSSASEKYDLIQSLNNSINNSKDETGSSLSKFTPNGKNQFKRLNIERANFLSWDKNMISAWLYKIGLGYTVSHTRRWLTSGQDLVNESKKSLAQLMDIRNPLHLKKLLIHIRLCMKDHCPNNNNHYNYGYLCRNIEPPENFDIPGWLVDLGLSSYIPQFDNCIIDPYVLDQLTMDDLSVLKMSNELHVLSLRWGIQMLRHINFDRTRLCRSHMEQCEANISKKGNMLNSPIQSQNHTQDNMKPIDRYNRNHMDSSTLNSINSIKSESMNSEIKSIYSTYLPIQICYWTQQRVMNWLESIELPEYASKLCGSGVHGALMILEDRFTPDLLADILQISPVKSLVRRHLTNKFIELVGLDIWERKQHHEVNNNNNSNNTHSKHNPLTIHSKIKFTKKKSIFHSNREHKFSYHDLVTGGTGDEDANTELVCPIEINPDHMSIFAEEIVKPNCQIIHPQTEIIPTILIDPVATSVQHLELQETDL